MEAAGDSGGATASQGRSYCGSSCDNRQQCQISTLYEHKPDFCKMLVLSLSYIILKNQKRRQQAQLLSQIMFLSA